MIRLFVNGASSCLVKSILQVTMFFAGIEGIYGLQTPDYFSDAGMHVNLIAQGAGGLPALPLSDTTHRSRIHGSLWGHFRWWHSWWN